MSAQELPGSGPLTEQVTEQAAEQAAQAEKEAQEAKAREIATSQQKIARIRRETEMLNQQ